MERDGSLDIIAKTEYLQKNLRKPVVLVGLMGTGKSQAGRRLAQKLRLEFYDSDRLVEARAGRSIREIFETDGETKFRAFERDVMLDLLNRGPCVIATGGGAITNYEILSTLKEKSISIWLKADIDEILERLKHDQDRPLLKSGDPATVLAALLSQREALYNQADLTIESPPDSLEQTAPALIKSLYAYLNPDNV